MDFLSKFYMIHIVGVMIILVATQEDNSTVMATKIGKAEGLHDALDPEVRGVTNIIASYLVSTSNYPPLNERWNQMFEEERLFKVKQKNEEIYCEWQKQVAEIIEITKEIRDRSVQPGSEQAQTRLNNFITRLQKAPDDGPEALWRLAAEANSTTRTPRLNQTNELECARKNLTYLAARALYDDDNIENVCPTKERLFALLKNAECTAYLSIKDLSIKDDSCQSAPANRIPITMGEFSSPYVTGVFNFFDYVNGTLNRQYLVHPVGAHKIIKMYSSTVDHNYVWWYLVHATKNKLEFLNAYCGADEQTSIKKLTIELVEKKGTKRKLAEATTSIWTCRRRKQNHTN